MTSYRACLRRCQKFSAVCRALLTLPICSIRQCAAIQAGKRYETDDLDGSGDKRYFQQCFEPPPRAILVEPIFGSKQNVLGLIMVGSMLPAPFDVLKKRYFWNFV